MVLLLLLTARIELIGIRDGWRAGQYAFLRCFSFGAGAHPFTIASASGSRSALGCVDLLPRAHRVEADASSSQTTRHYVYDASRG